MSLGSEYQSTPNLRSDESSIRFDSWLETLPNPETIRPEDLIALTLKHQQRFLTERGLTSPARLNYARILDLDVKTGEVTKNGESEPAILTPAQVIILLGLALRNGNSVSPKSLELVADESHRPLSLQTSLKTHISFMRPKIGDKEVAKRKWQIIQPLYESNMYRLAPSALVLLNGGLPSKLAHQYPGFNRFSHEPD